MRPPRALAFFGAFVALCLVARGALVWVEIVNVDEAAHIVGSWELLRGRLLYTDFADHKPPLLYAYYALSQIVFGRGMLGVRLFTLLVAVPLTALAASAFFGHDRRGFTAGALYLVSGAAFIGHDMLSVSSELLMLLPASWSLVLVRDETVSVKSGRWAMAGLLLGVASLVKYQAGLWLPALALAATGSLRRRAPAWVVSVTALVVGFALPWGAAYSFFAHQGGAQGFVYWNVTHNLHYAANPISPREALERGVANFLPFLLATAALWWGFRRSLDLLAGLKVRLVAWLLLFSLLMAILGFRFYPHYFIPVYLPLALGAAPWFAQASSLPVTRGAKVALGYGLFVFLGFTAANVFLYEATDVYEETRPVFRRVAGRLRDDPCFPGANLFVWGFAPGFYYFADLPVASRFVMPQASLTGYVPGNLGSVGGRVATEAFIRPEHWDLLVADLLRNRATYILDTSPAGIHRWNHYPLASFPRLRDLVHESYDLIDVVDRVAIYRRDDCLAEPSPRAALPRP